jgi:hypothetical protein
MSSISLPPDMLMEILSRLPPKSLLRFRCVSKTWLALIGNHDSKLLKDSILTTRNPTHPLPRILVKAADKSNAEKIVFFSLSYDTLDCVSQIQMILPPVPYNFIKPKCYLELVASSNGLLCLYDFRINVFYLWNPTTSYVGFKVIPLMDRYCLGFGFDPNSGDFKVVNCRSVKNESGKKALIAEVGK